MKLNNILKNLIKENHNNNCIKLFGKKLFDKEMGGKEPNTDIENDYAELIYQFSGEDYGPLITQEFIDAISELKKCMSTYPEVLYPNETTVYRGTTISLQNLMSISIPNENESVNYVYKAYSPIQSWSLALKSATDFVGDDKHIINTLRYDIEYDNIEKLELKDLNKFLKLRVPIVIEYVSSEKDFLFNIDSFTKLSEFWSEKEIIRIDNEPINTKLYINYKKINTFGVAFLNRIKSLLDID